MTSHGYIIMIIVDSCMIWFDCDCIMQLKKSNHIVTNVCSRKSAITFGDLPDCSAINQWNYRENDLSIFFSNPPGANELIVALLAAILSVSQYILW